MPTAKEEIDALLEDCDPRKPGMIESNVELANAIRYFLFLKDAGDDRVKGLSLAWFYENKLRSKFNGPKTVDTVRAYVREVMLRDPSTGKPL